MNSDQEPPAADDSDTLTADVASEAVAEEVSVSASKPTPKPERTDALIIVHFNPQFIKAHHVDFESVSCMTTMEPNTEVQPPCSCGVSKFSLVMHGVLDWCIPPRPPTPPDRCHHRDEPEQAVIRSVAAIDGSDATDSKGRSVNVPGLEAKSKKQRSQITALRKKVDIADAGLRSEKKVVAKMTKQMRSNDEQLGKQKETSKELALDLSKAKEQLITARKAKERALEDRDKARSEASNGVSEAGNGAATAPCPSCDQMSRQQQQLQLSYQQLQTDHQALVSQMESLRTSVPPAAIGLPPPPAAEHTTGLAAQDPQPAAVGVVARVSKSGDDISLELDCGGSAVEFMAGQWSALTLTSSSGALPASVRPCVLSFLSSPSELPKVRFNINAAGAEMGSFRYWAATSAAAGDKIQLTDGRGSAALSRSMMPEPLGEMLFLGGGSAISPLVSILRECLSGSTCVAPAKLTLIHSAASSAIVSESPLGCELAQLQQQHPAELVVRATVTQEAEGSGWSGRTGRVDEAMLKPYSKRCGMFFVCGGPQFVTGVVKMLLALLMAVLQLGVWPPRIKSDYAPDPAAAPLSPAPREKRRQLRKARESELDSVDAPQRTKGSPEQMLPGSVSSALSVRDDEEAPEEFWRSTQSQQFADGEIKSSRGLQKSSSRLADRLEGCKKQQAAAGLGLMQQRASASMENTIQAEIDRRQMKATGARKKGSAGGRVVPGMLVHMDPIAMSLKVEPRSIQNLRGAPRRHPGPAVAASMHGEGKGARRGQPLHYTLAPRPPRPGSAKASSVPLFH